MWKKLIRDYLTFTRWERNGLIVLLIIIICIIFFPQVAVFFNPGKAPDFTLFKSQVDSFENTIAKTQTKDHSIDISQKLPSGEDKVPSGNIKNPASPLFTFNPNTASNDEFKKLGLSDRVIKTIQNYRSKGGKFFKKEDLKKIYGLNNETYGVLAPYVRIPNESLAEDVPVKAHEIIPVKNKLPNALEKPLVDLNTADSLQLVSLPGIGAVLSSRILKYRKRIGGFYSSTQLHEVYGLPPETFEEIKARLTVDTDLIRKISINTVTLDELKQHPYFKYPVANTIISYREQHGFFKSLVELKNVDVITDELYERLLPYLQL